MPAQRNSSAQLQLKVWWSFFIPYACYCSCKSQFFNSEIAVDRLYLSHGGTYSKRLLFSVKLNLKDDLKNNILYSIIKNIII